MSDNQFADLEFDKECEACEGRGSWDAAGKYQWCDECNGKGEVLTELGEKLLEFMRKHISVRSGFHIE